ncbi:MAG: cytidylate kinase-like family protein [Synergistaceae bacterium]|nr:cytidylate kinase-like family protein [Synergistaceae bacterium]MBR0203531.1 cytidylate kinase-like family protein [Synergistaceae bacterium]
MNKIITIGREFGSGGREVGRRIAELLGIAYYDREIIAEIAKRTSLSENYVRNVAEHKPVIPFPIHTGRTFWAVIPDYGQSVQQEQHNIIREMASHSDCVIVGRGADYILRDFNPFRLFIYSDMSSKIKRCQDNSTSDYDRGAGMTEDELEKRINQINKSRADYYEFYTGQKWGDKANYDLCINTAKIEPIKIAEFVAKIC